MKEAIHEHARVLLLRELGRRQGDFAALPESRRRVVEAAALGAVAAAVAELLAQAARDERWAAVLASIYTRDDAGSIVPAGVTAG